MPKDYFPKVKEAREALREKAVDILNKYLEVVEEARAAGDHQVAVESLQWLIEHMPEDDGHTMVSPSVDKQDKGGSSAPPTIQIGFALGGLPQKQLPAPVIDIEDVKSE